jgi:DNA-binding beta-propeller fold protein YncE
MTKKLLALASLAFAAGCATMELPTGGTPKFAVDPYWPKPLPENWILGQVSGIAVDRNDHIWVVHRPLTLVDDEKGAQLNPPTTKCCKPAPAVLEFDREGNLLRHWGGPGAGYDWPKSEHGLFVDDDGNVWVGANDPEDHHILKFTPDGKFLMQIGKPKSTGGSNSTTQLGRPAHMVIDSATGEMYIADGYLNRRVMVVDSKTGQYRRHWGAYGNRPNDDKQAAYDPKAPLAQQFANPVHCVRISNDGFVYVCDRQNDRIQVFTKDGKFVKEFRVEPQTMQNGSVWDLVLSEDRAQKYIFLADGANNQVVVLSRGDGSVLSTVGRAGRMAGQFKWVHNIAIDSRGNIYTAEVGFGRRAQKFTRVQ